MKKIRPNRRVRAILKKIRRDGSLIAFLLATTAIANAAEVVSSDRCDKACHDSFGHRPMAYCQTALTKTALGETSVRHDEFFANYRPDENGGWFFDIRTERERTAMRFASDEFTESTGALSFTYRSTTITGTCRRFSGQTLKSATTERRPLAAPSTGPRSLWRGDVSSTGGPQAFTRVKVWDSYVPSTGRYIRRDLQVGPNDAYRLVATDHDVAGASNSGSVCDFNAAGWSDCIDQDGNHYQLKPTSIRRLLNMANGDDPGPSPSPGPAVTYGPWERITPDGHSTLR